MSNPHPFPIDVVGHGPQRVIVAHGWMGDRTLYDEFLPTIDREASSYAFFDCRGYGTRRGEEGPLTVEAIAEDVVAVADALGWDEFHVLGHSMGGMAAQRLMADRPERLRSAILLAPVPASGARIDDERRRMLGEAISSPDARRRLIDANTGRLRDDAWLDRIRDFSVASTTTEGLEGYMASWTGGGFQSEVEGSGVEVLVVVGALDPGAPLERIEGTIMKWYPTSRLVQMQNVGHYPMMEAPEELSAILTEHLAGRKGVEEMV